MRAGDGLRSAFATGGASAPGLGEGGSVMRSLGIAVGLLLVALGMSAQAQAPAPTARVETGALAGVSAEGVTSFKGVPYARPPVGDLRWRAPQPAPAWSGVRPADRVGALCMQAYNKTDNGVGPLPMSEDCLSLNVFAPTGAARLPVMVWIHGGGLVNGSGTAALYDGSALARQGVVVVAINYRLGRFGFFAHPALTAEAKGGATANYGLMDQLAALRWVKRNIAAFGGDPSNVTVFGESAGGASVDRLMMIRQARGLFHKVIAQSPAGSEHGLALAQAEAAGVAFAAKLGATGAGAAALRALPAEAVVSAGELQMGRGEAPILDGVMLSQDPLAAFAAGREARVPYLVGSNSLEVPKAFGEFYRRAAELPPGAEPAVRAAYLDAATYEARIATDNIFAAPARAFARTHAAHGAPTFLYRFSVVSAKAPPFGGAIHASDRQYVFQTLNASTWPTDARDAARAREISAYWVNFAKHGDPNGPGLPSWPAYGPDDRLMDFTNEGPAAEPTPDARALDAVAAMQARPRP